MPAYTYEFDPTGALLANKITGEQQILSASNGENHHFIVPTFAPFFSESLSISYRDAGNTVHPLVEGIDYHLGFQFIGASRACAKPIYGAISFLDLQLAGVVTLTYQTLGGQWALSMGAELAMLSDTLRNPRTATWEQVVNVPQVFPPVDHQWNLDDMVGMSEVVAALGGVASAIAAAAPTDLQEQPNLFPTKDQLGLGNVDNFKTASDQESRLANSPTRFMTARGVGLALQEAFISYVSSNPPRKTAAAMPVTGNYVRGEYVDNTSPTVLTWTGVVGALVGRKYVVLGWKRLTSGSGHVLNVDWVEDRTLTGT